MILIRIIVFIIVLGLNLLKQIFRVRTNYYTLKSFLNRMFQNLRYYFPARTLVLKFLSRFNGVKSLISQINDSRTDIREKVILICIGSLGNGGAERQWANIAIGLKHEGYIPIIVTENNLTEASNWIVEDLEAFKIPVISVSEQLLRGKELIKNKYKFMFLDKKFDEIYSEICQKIDFDDTFIAVCEIVKEFHPTAIITALDPININFCLSGLLKNVPKIVMSFRSVSPNNYEDIFKIKKYDYEIYKYLYFHSSIIKTSNSEHGTKSYRSYFQDLEEKINVKLIPNSIVLTDIAIKKLTSGSATKCCSKFHIFGAMRFSPEKSPYSWLDLIEFMYLRDQSYFHFILYGSGIQKKGVLSRIYYLKSHGVNIDYGGHSDFIFNIFYEKGLVMSTSLFEGHSNLEEEARMFHYNYIKIFDQRNIIIESNNKDEYSSKLLTLSKLNKISDEVMRMSKEKMPNLIDLNQYSVVNSRTLRIQLDLFKELCTL